MTPRHTRDTRRAAVLALLGALGLAGCGTPAAAPLAPTATPRPAATATPLLAAPSPTSPAAPTATTAPLSPTPLPVPPTATDTALPSPTPSASPSATGLPAGTARDYHPAPRVASVWPTATPVPVLVVQGTTTEKAIAFTFDAGADRGFAPAILAFLRAHHMHATFGMTGLWAAANPDLVAQMVRDGHQIINHTWDHRSMTGYSTNAAALSATAVYDELDTTDALIGAITGSSSRPFWRAPYGDETAYLRQLIANHGYPVDVRWTLDSLGWNGLSVAAITSRMLAAAAPGAIYLLHVGARSQDALALPGVWQDLAARGYRAVTVAELLGGSPTTAATAAGTYLRRPLSYTDVDPSAVYYPPPGGVAAGGPLSGTTVILDPGHGGDDPGTCYPYTPDCYTTNGTAPAAATLDEKVVTLDVCLYRLLPLLHANGAGVYLTRTSNDQNPDLESRLQLSNYVARLTGRTARNVAFVSLHFNGSSDPTSDYTQSLFALNRPRALAQDVQAMMAARLVPPPIGGDHGLDDFQGHVTRRNVAPSLIAEPVFLTHAFETTAPVSVTTRITTTLAALAPQRRHLSAVTLTIGRRVAGLRPRGQPAYVVVGTIQVHSLSVVGREPAIPTPPVSTMVTATATAAAGTTPTPLPTPGGITATLLPTGTLVMARPMLPRDGVVLTVTGEISGTAVRKVWAGEGPWLALAHAHTLAANADYNTPVLPAALSTTVYPYDDREEQIARAILQGLARYFGRPRLRSAASVARLNRLDPITAVAPGAPAPSGTPTMP